MIKHRQDRSNCKYFISYRLTHNCYNTITGLLVLAIVLYLPELNNGQHDFPINETDIFTIVNLNRPVQRLLYYPKKNLLFVGARNSILKFNLDNLNVSESYTFGPVEDNINCQPSPLECPLNQRTLTNADNVNLFFHNVSGNTFILACYTTNQGMCYLFPFSNFELGKLLGAPNNTLNYFASRSSSYVLSVPEDVSTRTTGGSLSKDSKESVIFVAHAYDGRPSSLLPPSFSKRKLSKPVNFTLWSDGNWRTAINLLPAYQSSKWPVKYIYGFQHDNFIYFIKMERINHTKEELVTRLIRVCKNDRSFGSYSEMRLTCQGQNIATSATVGKMDNYLTNTFKGQFPALQSSAVLYVSFSNFPLEDKYPTGLETRLCAYSLDQLSFQFEIARNACFLTKMGKFVDTIADPKTSCELFPDTGDKCNQQTNYYIEVTKPFDGFFLYKDKPRITSMISALQGSANRIKYTLIIGTEHGFVKKIVDGRVIYTLDLSHSLIEPDPQIDRTEDNVIFATGQLLIKLAIKSCSVYKECGACIESQVRDTIDCVWNGQKCVLNNGAVKSQNFCVPKIKSFSPKKGPTSGGTLVKVLGSDLGYQDGTANTENNINVAGANCQIRTWTNTEITCTTSATTNSPAPGPIRVTVRDVSARKGYDIIGTADTDENFQFLAPNVTQIDPIISPASGGVDIFIRGTNLDIGSNTSVTLANIPCVPLEIIDASALQCTSGAIKEETLPHTGSVRVRIDSALLVPNVLFSYLGDPVFLSLQPNITSASSGGNITIIGSNFTSLNKPRIIVNTVIPRPHSRPIKLENDCYSENSTMLVCSSPVMPSSVTLESPITASIAFSNGGSNSFVDTDLLLVYLPDPKFSEQVIAKKDGETGILEIMGQHLHIGYGMKIVLVNQQDGITLQCENLRSIDGHDRNLIACDIPLNDYTGDPTASLWNITVTTGTKSYFIGMAPITIAESATSSTPTVIGIVISLITLIAAFSLTAMYILNRKGFLMKKKHLPSLGVAYRSNENGQFQRHGSQNEYHGTDSRISGQPLLFDRQSDEIKFVLEPEKQSELQAEGVLFSRDYITREKVIGQGNFGLVYQGYLQLPSKQEKIKVAIKTLKTDRGILTQAKGEAFLSEGLIMKEFCHENVLSLVGVSIDFDGSPMILTPYMENGDLRSYIQREDFEFTVIELIQFGVQVAQGMVYLAGLKFVHRDLAARNCMVDEHQTVKVADFGLSRDVYTTSYYSDDDNLRKPLPRKWMAIESLERGTYDTKSDVWSYGVLLWELLTRGDIPYPDVEDWKMKDYLKVGYRLPRPEHCPPEVYSVMKECWVEDPKSRPTFVEILKLIEVAIESNEKKYLEQKTNRNIRYINDPSIFTNPEYDGTMIITS